MKWLWISDLLSALISITARWEFTWIPSTFSFVLRCSWPEVEIEGSENLSDATISFPAGFELIHLPSFSPLDRLSDRIQVKTLAFLRVGRSSLAQVFRTYEQHRVIYICFSWEIWKDTFRWVKCVVVIAWTECIQVRQDFGMILLLLVP